MRKSELVQTKQFTGKKIQTAFPFPPQASLLFPPLLPRWGILYFRTKPLKSGNFHLSDNSSGCPFVDPAHEFMLAPHSFRQQQARGTLKGLNPICVNTLLEAMQRLLSVWVE